MYAVYNTSMYLLYKIPKDKAFFITNITLKCINVVSILSLTIHICMYMLYENVRHLN